MEKVLDFIKKNKMFKAGDVVGVGVSGGIDSMGLLHFLNSVKEELDIEVVAITVDHCLREESAFDCAFVQRWCREHKIRCYKFKVDCSAIAKSKGISIEEAAREGRFGIFDNFVKKQMVDKIALAHHMQDQAETILFHLIRGSGTTGLKGIEAVRGVYVRPLLETEKSEIVEYVYQNEIQYVDDATNEDTKFQRNFIRHKVLPLLRTTWPAVDKTICNFARLAKQDDEFISRFAENTCFLKSKNIVQLPTNYFIYDQPVVSRMIFGALSKINSSKDVESKHIEMILELANAENGSSIDLPNKVKAIKEYENIVFVKQEEKKPLATVNFKCGKTVFGDIGKFNVKKSLDLKIEEDVETIDVKKLPKGCVWRTRQRGDEITKLNNGKKSLKDYFIDKKVPQRLRDRIPVLANGSDILVVAGFGISDKVKVDEKTTYVYKISFEETSRD